MLAFLVVGLILSSTAFAEKRRKYKIVVNAANQVQSFGEQELSKIFLKGTPAWADGSEITPIDLDPESSIRKAFTKDIHGRDVNEVKVFWQTQIFSGKAVPLFESLKIVFVQGLAGFNLYRLQL